MYDLGRVVLALFSYTYGRVEVSYFFACCFVEIKVSKYNLPTIPHRTAIRGNLSYNPSRH